MWKFIKKLIYQIGKWSEKSTDTYTPRYRGYWKNKGTSKDEKWEWVEKVTSIRKCYVNVVNIEDDYIITIGHHPRDNSIEVVQCDDDKEVEIALSLLKAYYSKLGNVVISTEFE